MEEKKNKKEAFPRDKTLWWSSYDDNSIGEAIT